MGAENDDFGQLRVLLSLKRHEQPPPRFFDEFASRVAARIQAPDEAEASGTMFSRWFENLGLGPVPACACALIACLLDQPRKQIIDDYLLSEQGVSHTKMEVLLNDMDKAGGAEKLLQTVGFDIRHKRLLQRKLLLKP